METAVSVKEFYKDVFGKACPELEQFLDGQNNNDIGHFNVFNIADMYGNGQCKAKPSMPYNRRTYYKISLIKGKNKVEFADRVVDIEEYGVLFATPKIPYRYTPQDTNQQGHFCIFTKDFLTRAKTGLVIDDVPVFKTGSQFIYSITQQQYEQIESVFAKMHAEITSDYEFKYDLLRNYVVELIHYGQKLKPVTAVAKTINASARITTLFIELLERQFPIESINQVLQLRTAKDYADMLRVHVNHLNKVLRETTGKTTTEIIASRVIQEAKVLLKQTSWNISEIAFTLGFDEVAHFSNFFKKQANLSPLSFRK